MEKNQSADANTTLSSCNELAAKGVALPTHVTSVSAAPIIFTSPFPFLWGGGWGGGGGINDSQGEEKSTDSVSLQSSTAFFFLNVCVGVGGGGGRASGRALAIITTHVKYMSALYLSLNY